MITIHQHAKVTDALSQIPSSLANALALINITPGAIMLKQGTYHYQMWLVLHIPVPKLDRVSMLLLV